MPPSTPGFTELCERARAGCPEAARTLYDTYSKDILRLIRRKLDPRLRVLYDSQDFLQETWLALFTRSLQEQYFSSPDNLVAFLRRVAAHKVYDANCHHLDTKKADLACRISIQSEASASHEPFDPRPGPSAQAQIDDAWTKLVAALPQGHRNLLRLLCAGYTQADIARLFNTDVGVIHLLMKRIRSQFPSLLAPLLA